MRTDFLWAELMTRAELLEPTETQRKVLVKLADAAFLQCPEAVRGNINIECDMDGDLIIKMKEAVDGVDIVNGQWAELSIDGDGFCRLSGRDIEVPIYGSLT